MRHPLKSGGVNGGSNDDRVRFLSVNLGSRRGGGEVGRVGEWRESCQKSVKWNERVGNLN